VANRLLIYTENYSRGGSNRYLLYLLEAVSSKFDESIVASNQNGLFPEEMEVFKGSKKLIELKIASKVLLQLKTPQVIKNHLILRKIWGFFLLCGEPFIDIYNAVLFGLFILRIKPSRILVFNGGYPGGTSCLVMVVVSKMMRIKVDMSIVSMPTPRRSYLQLVEKVFDLIVWKCSNQIITNCGAIGLSLTELRALPVNKSITILNGVKDLSIYTPKSYPSAYINRKIIIGFVSRIEESKGVFVLLNAFLKLEDLHQDFELRFYGDGSDHEKLVKMIKTKKISHKVKAFGHYFGDISKIMAEIDIFVSPSFWEGLPYSLLEAMRSGLAIIATDVGGTTEAVENLVSGLVVPPRSEEAILVAIMNLASRPDLMNSIGNGAREAFLTKFESGKTRGNVHAFFSNSQ
jgi:glycosyltransferase involved in cell wall biosynthesis